MYSVWSAVTKKLSAPGSNPAVENMDRFPNWGTRKETVRLTRTHSLPMVQQHLTRGVGCHTVLARYVQKPWDDQAAKGSDAFSHTLYLQFEMLCHR